MAKKPKKRTFYQAFGKRCGDIILSFLALVILLPLFLVIAVLSRCFIGGKVFFTAYRPGKDGKIFKLYKFKSMTDKRDASGNLLPDAERLTRFGRFLRKTSLDELPQLINILRGDMSIIGPRPRAIIDFVFYSQEQLAIYSVRPGLTGLSQVSGGRSTASWEEIFAKDLEYRQNITFWGDVKIFFKTIGVFFSAKDGAVGGSTDSKRAYFYRDYLYQNHWITKEQYDLGGQKANELATTPGQVTYQPELQKSVENNSGNMAY